MNDEYWDGIGLYDGDHLLAPPPMPIKLIIVDDDHNVRYEFVCHQCSKQVPVLGLARRSIGYFRLTKTLEDYAIEAGMRKVGHVFFCKECFNESQVRS